MPCLRHFRYPLENPQNSSHLGKSGKRLIGPQTKTIDNGLPALRLSPHQGCQLLRRPTNHIHTAGRELVSSVIQHEDLADFSIQSGNNSGRRASRGHDGIEQWRINARKTLLSKCRHVR